MKIKFLFWNVLKKLIYYTIPIWLFIITGLMETCLLYTSKKAELAAGLEALNQQEEEINSGLAQAEQEISQKQQELDALQAQIDELEATIASDPDSVTEEMKAKLSELKGQWESGNSVLANARTELEAKKAPVSYTHLDVYKRQGKCRSPD